MSDTDERAYLATRARQAREQAGRADRPEARRVHLELAKRYEERAKADSPGPQLRIVPPA